ncbi:MAG: polyamine ABC transporter ATP-binding protein [Brachymonas sp.]|nr:polyamine ABC transporter ATP-binding protein [Brachymonas sp.]
MNTIPLEEKFLATENLVKRFGDVVAVNDVSLSIKKGEIFALLGSSGCGKSTLLRMLAGFERPTSGRILLGGQDIAGLPPYERPINMMFQSYALFPHLNVADNIAFGLKREGMPKDQIAQRVDEMLQLVRLRDYATRKPHQLSGGQQQRVALARSLAKRPQLLLLDEPLGALDKKLREQTQFELVNIIESVGVTVVMVTHDQEEAMTMASRVAVMSEGRVLQVGKPQEVYEYPNCRFVADFIGNVNLLDGTVHTSEPSRTVIDTVVGQVEVGHGVSVAEGMPISLAIRPEKIRISTEAPDAAKAAKRNVFRGKVIEIAYLGDVNTYIVLMPNGTRLKITDINSVHESEGDITWEDEVYFWWHPLAAVALTQ